MNGRGINSIPLTFVPLPKTFATVECSGEFSGIHPIWILFELWKIMFMDFKEPVKRLLRHGRTGKFFRGDGRWTTRPERALDFPHVMHVVHTCLLLGLRDVELVLHFGDKTQTVPLNCR